MERPVRFENHRWLGDKRTQIAHDVDHCTAPERVEELLSSGQFAAFGPDVLDEARNRGYRRCALCQGAVDAAEAELEEALDSSA